MNEPLDFIMLIDDNRDDNFFNELIIKENKAAKKVMAFLSGMDALDYLQKEGAYAGQEIERPNIIFLDINMPVMNGFEFLDEYEELDAKYQGDVLVVMLTTSKHPKDLAEAKRRNIKHFHNKALNGESLWKIIEDNFGENALA